MRLALPAILALLLRIVAPAPLRAQASPYVPLDSWSSSYVEHLIRSGVIEDPDPMTRPLRVAQVLAALAKADTSQSPPAIRETVRELVQRLTPRGTEPHFHMEFDGGGSASTQARRDPLRDSGSHVYAYHFGDHATATFGPFVLSSHILIDRRIHFDPDYKGDTAVQQFSGLITDAYVSAQGKYGELFLGSMQRNWGPTGISGALVSAEPYSYNHLMWRVGVKSLRIESLITQLDYYLDPVTGVVDQRHWVSHRLFIQPIRPLIIVVTQGTLWFGPGRGIEFRWLNPLQLNSETRLSESQTDSLKQMGGIQFRIQFPRKITLQSDITVGDLRTLPIYTTLINPTLGSSGAPSRLVETLVLDVPLSPGASMRGLYTFVTNLMYRSSDPRKTVALRGIGLGRNYADYAQYTLTGSFLPRPMVVLSPELTYLRQGQGDFRQPFPRCPCALLFEGVAENTLRAALGGRLQLNHHLDIEGNGGLHFVSNRGHVRGISATRFVGMLSLTYRFGVPIPLP